MTPLLVAVAGGLGAGTRWSVDAWLRPRVGRHPWSTAAVNVTGSFLLGLLVGATAGGTWPTVLGTGFLGGYTTFGTASVETAQLALDRRYLAATTNAAAVLVVSVAAASVGFVLGR